MEDITIDSEYRKENKSTKEQLEATSYVYSIDQAKGWLQILKLKTLSNLPVTRLKKTLETMVLID